MLIFKSLFFLASSYLASSTLILPSATNVTAGCTITDYSQVSSVISSCTNIVIQNLNVPSGKILGLSLKDGTTLTFRGTTSFEVGYNDIWLITISGNHITIIGEKGSLIHGNGEKYWDGQGGSGGVTKPRLLQIKNVHNGVFKNIALKNCPMFCTGIEGSSDLSIDGWNADCSEGDNNQHKGRNTDGIGISGSTNININNVFIHNQDQCLYVNQGSNMHFTGIHCVGSNGICATAGFSQTSYEINTTKNITFHNCVLEGGLTGVQIIAMANGGPGEISDVTFQNVELKGVRQQGIYVQMDFGNDGHYNNNIEVKNFRLSNIFGTVEGNGARQIYIKAGAKCHDWTFSNIALTGGGTKNSCNYVPNGFSC